MLRSNPAMKSISKILAKDWKKLRSGTPGSRFIEFYRARAARRAEGWPLERVVILALGVALFVGGLAIGWLPGPGGFVAVIGAALLGAESRRISKVLDYVEARLRDAWRFFRRRVLHRPPA
jgi:Flp pilus assembly protein TadB